MLEFPEVAVISTLLNEEIRGRTVTDVFPPTKEHKFCWFQGSPEEYGAQLRGGKIVSAEGFGIFAAINFDNGKQLCFNDGVNVRLTSGLELPKIYQLAVLLDDGRSLVFTVAMYGGIILHDGGYDNEYYLKSRKAVSPLSEEFPACYFKIFSECKPSLSVKAFLAAEQRFPGIGNGVLQDILFEARLHPKRKLATLSGREQEKLLWCMVKVLKEMMEAGGRDTEKNIYGRRCGYRTKMSKNSLSSGCPVCKGQIIKETYLGGSVYYCPACQPYPEQ